jgi:hypothetical protein
MHRVKNSGNLKLNPLHVCVLSKVKFLIVCDPLHSLSCVGVVAVQKSDVAVCLDFCTLFKNQFA